MAGHRTSKRASREFRFTRKETILAILGLLPAIPGLAGDDPVSRLFLVLSWALLVFVCIIHEGRTWKRALTAAVISTILLALGTYRHWPQRPPTPPAFSFQTKLINAPIPGDDALTIEQAQRRRIYELQITNPNNDKIDLGLETQFPEAILKIETLDASPEYTFSASEIWDKQPIRVEAIGAPNEKERAPVPQGSIEPFGKEQKTGLWRIIIKNLPAHESAKIDFFTTIGSANDLYCTFTTQFAEAKMRAMPIWLLYGGFKYSPPNGGRIYPSIIPLEYDPARREIQCDKTILDGIASFPCYRIVEGHGIRMPGFFSSSGYAYIFSSVKVTGVTPATAYDFIFQGEEHLKDGVLSTGLMTDTMEPYLTFQWPIDKNGNPIPAPEAAK